MKDGYNVTCTASSNFLLDKGRVTENLQKECLYYFTIHNDWNTTCRCKGGGGTKISCQANKAREVDNTVTNSLNPVYPSELQPFATSGLKLVVAQRLMIGSALVRTTPSASHVRVYLRWLRRLKTSSGAKDHCQGRLGRLKNPSCQWHGFSAIGIFESGQICSVTI